MSRVPVVLGILARHILKCEVSAVLYMACAIQMG